MSRKIFLYHQKEPQGRLFDFDKAQENFESMTAEGWVDTPAKLDLPKEDKVHVTKEQTDNMAPDELIGLVKSMGFVVMTPEELDARLAQAKQEAFNGSDTAPVPEEMHEQDLGSIEPPSLPEEPVVQEEDEALDMQEVAKVFTSEPEALTKDELIAYGNEVYDLKLTRSMKEETLISKIKEAQEG